MLSAQQYFAILGAFSIMKNYKTFVTRRIFWNDDKSSSAANTLISFEVNQAVSVYVAYDTRILESRPSWLLSWEDTGSDLGTNDSDRRLYRKSFASGTIPLGGNGENHSGGYSMYTVLVAAQNSSCGVGGWRSGQMVSFRLL